MERMQVFFFSACIACIGGTFFLMVQSHTRVVAKSGCVLSLVLISLNLSPFASKFIWSSVNVLFERNFICFLFTFKNVLYVSSCACVFCLCLHILFKTCLP